MTDLSKCKVEQKIALGNNVEIVIDLETGAMS
jgi:hypothetical protein